MPAEQAGNPYQQPGNVEEEKFDAFDFAEEKDCLKKYDDAWCEKILGAPKWSDKKDMLTELIADIDTPKIKPGDSNALVTALKKLLTDSNITVFHWSIKSVGYLAKGLWENFREGAKTLVLQVLKKFAEKRTQINEDTKVAVQNILMSVPLIEVLESVVTSLADKNPNVIKYTAGFLDEGVR